MDNDGDTLKIDFLELITDTATVDKKKGEKRPGASALGLGVTPFIPPSVEVEGRQR